MGNGMTFRKKNRTTLYIGIATAVILIAIMGGLHYLQLKKDAKNTETETQQTEHTVLMYKTSDGTIEFEAEWMKSDTDSETILGIEENTLVTMLITPGRGKILESVDIVDYDFHEIDSFLRDAGDGTTRVNFVMPAVDIIMNFNFVEKDTETEPQEETELTEMEESETEGMPYGLTLHGVTPAIITSYNGQFDDRHFLQQLGDTLHIDSARSQYRDVTDVTFSTEQYAGEQETDKVYHYIYFNNNPDRKMVAIYYLNDNAYVFMETEEIETETETRQENPVAQNGNGTVTGTTSSVSSGSGYSGGSGAVSQTVETTSFDILHVSTVFLAFAGDDTGEAFYEKAFEYVLEKKMTGNIVGTFGTYSLYPEEKKAEFVITLNVGGTIRGTYNKAENTFEFSGL